MKKILIVILVILGVLFLLGRVSATQDKVTICHREPQKQDITIEVAQSAVQAHVDNHGDSLGACPASEEPPVEEEPETPVVPEVPVTPVTPTPTPVVETKVEPLQGGK